MPAQAPDLFAQAPDLYVKDAPPEAPDLYNQPSMGSAFKALVANSPVQTLAGLYEVAGNALNPPTQFPDVGSTVAKSLIQGEGIPAAIKSGAEALATGVQRKVFDAVVPQGVRDAGAELTRQGLMAGNEATADIQSQTPQDLNWLQEGALSAAASITQMAPWMLAARFGGAKVGGSFLHKGALGQFGGLQFGQAYHEALAGGADPETSMKHALTSGAAEIAGETLGLETLLKGGKAWFKKFLAQEIGGENLTTIAQSLSEKKYFNEGKWSSSDEIMHDLAVTTIGATLGAGGLKGMDSALRVFQKERQTNDFEDTKAAEELNAILARIPRTDMPTLKPELLVPLTPQEEATAAVQEKQDSSTFKVTPTAETAAFAKGLDERLGSSEVSPDEGGISDYVAGKREERAKMFPPANTPHSQRTIVASTDERALGLTLEQTGAPPPGSVVAIREEGQELVHPTEVYAMLTADLGAWVKKYAPTASVILNLEQFNEGDRANAFGFHQLHFFPGKNQDFETTHVITPRELPAFAKYGYSDPKTALGLVGGLSHEFGHLLRWEGFRGGLIETHGVDFAKRVMKGIEERTLTPEDLAELQAKSPKEAALVTEWQGKRARLMSGEMTATQFIEEWVGLRKLGESVARDLGENKSLYEWADNRLKRLGLSRDGATARELLVGKPENGTKYSLAQQKELARYGEFNEYMAEQFTRYSYLKGDILRSRFGKYFADTMERLRNLFKFLKTQSGAPGKTIIPPGVAFSDWMDQQTLRAKFMQKGVTGRFKFSKELQEAQRQIAVARLEQLQAEQAPVETPEETPAPSMELSQLLQTLINEANVGSTTQAEVTKVKEEAQAKEAKKAEKKAKRAKKAPMEALTEEQQATLKDVKQRGQEALDSLFPEGADAESEQDSRRYLALKEMLDKQQYAKFELWLEKLRNEQGSADRDYTSKVLERLPNKDRIKAATLDLTLKQRDVKQIERNFWKQFLQEHPAGFSWAEAQVALQNRITKLEPLKLSENKLHQVSRLGEQKFLGTRLNGQVYSKDVTVVWQGPIAMPEDMRSHHYPTVERYVSHSRYLDDGAVRNVIEQQSDAMQREREVRGGYGLPLTYGPYTAEEFTEVKQSATVLRKQLEADSTQPAEVKARYAQELYREMPSTMDFVFDAAGYAHANQVNYEEFSRLLSERERYFANLQPNETYSELLQVEHAGTDLSHWERWWWQQQIRDNVTLALEEGKTKLRFRSAETAALMEGWRKEISLPEMSLQKPANWGLKVDEPTQNFSQRIQFIEEDIILRSFSSFNKISVYLARPGDSLHTYVTSLLAKTAAKFTYDQSQGIYSRYANDIPAYLKKHFNAQPVVAYGQTWWEVDLTQHHPEANMAWDRDPENPLQPMNAQHVLAEQAGLTPEEARRPEVVQGAREAWERLRFESPYWKAFGGRTKAVGNDGLPVRVWSGEGTRTLVAGEIPASFFTTNPNNLEAPERKDRAAAPKYPQTQSFFLNLENPLEVEYAYGTFDGEEISQLVQQAAAAGHDGLILHHLKDPLDSSAYIAFAPTQVAMDSELSPLDETDSMDWDPLSDQQQATRGFSKLLQTIGDKTTRVWMRANNARAKGVDYLIQLQQVAGGQPNDEPLQAFMTAKWGGEQLKNQLQYLANETVKSMLNVFGSNSSAVAGLKLLLEKEQEQGMLAGELVGLDDRGNVVTVYGKIVGTIPQIWEVRDSAPLRQLMADNGLDPTTTQGKRILQHYLDVRNTLQLQFNGLANALWSNVMRKFAGKPLLQRREYLRIEALHQALREQPFVPVGHFGNYVLIVEKDQGSVAVGKRRYIPIYKQHFEDQAMFQQVYVKAQQVAATDPDVRVKSLVLDEEESLPMQLPRELLNTLEQTGEFTTKQMDLLEALLIPAKYDKIAAKYKKLGSALDGGSKDFPRTFAAFTWHNSNFVWKLKYGPALRAAASLARANVRRLEQEPSLSPEEKLTQITRQRRNASLMDRATTYMLHPKGELQALRYWFTMAYLAYGISTAAFNLSTQINYWAAISSEYEKGKGSDHYLQSLKDTASIPWWGAAIASPNTPPAEKVRLLDLQAAYARAVTTGLLDQSYAYFLAGQANAGGILESTATTAIGKLAHTTLEMGMIPFRAVERGNRISTFLGFYSAERALGVPSILAYSKAAEKTDLLQNAYDPANKPELLRGKKAILFMFASYTQFIQWTMAGGYERTARAQQKAEGREVTPVWRGATVKLWLIYGLLGGLLGLPGAQNLLDLVKWAWRKFFGTANAELELRRFFKDLGLDQNIMLHGILHDFMGFDMSGKFGLGRVLPGTDLLNRDFQDPFTGVGQATLQSAGPAGGIAADGIRMLGKFGQGDIRGGFKEFPGVIGAVSKAYDAYLSQENASTYGVTTPSGERLTWDQQRGMFRDLTGKELVGMALGFTPKILSENRTEHYLEKGEEIYWRTRHSDLLDKRFRAVRTGDASMLENVTKEISKYNEQVPTQQLRITGKDQAVSLRGRRKAAMLAERQGLAGPTGRALARDVRGVTRSEDEE